MGAVKEPVNVLLAKGKTHLTKAEIDRRRSEEIVPKDTRVIIPPYLDETEQAKFVELADMLIDLKVWSVLDSEELARYVKSAALYECFTVKMEEYIAKGDIETARQLQHMQDKAFRQAHSLASSLCLNITGRCRVTIAPEEVANDDEKQFVDIL